MTLQEQIHKAIDMLPSGNPELRQSLRDLVSYKQRLVPETFEVGYLNLIPEIQNVLQGTVEFTFATDGDFSEFIDNDRGARRFVLFEDTDTDVGNYVQDMGEVTDFIYDPNTDKTTFVVAFGQGNIPDGFTGLNPSGLLSAEKSPTTQLEWDIIEQVTQMISVTPSNQRLFREISIGSLKGRDYRIAEILTDRLDGGGQLINLMRQKTARLPGRYAKEKRVLELFLSQFE